MKVCYTRVISLFLDGAENYLEWIKEFFRGLGKNFIIWFKSFKWKERWGDLITFMVPLLLSIILGIDRVSEYLGDIWLFIIIGLLLFISVIGWLKSIENSISMSETINEKNQIDAQKEHLEGLLISLPEELCKILSDKWTMGTDARITIYRHTEEDFIPVSRYAKNPDFDKIRRPSYPKNTGYIKECWAQEDGVYINSLPDPETNPQEYIDIVNAESKMLKKDIMQLPMKSRSYFGKTLFDSNGQAFILVMIESTKPEIKNISLIEEDLKGAFSKFVTTAVKSNILPTGGGSIE